MRDQTQLLHSANFAVCLRCLPSQRFPLRLNFSFDRQLRINVADFKRPEAVGDLFFAMDQSVPIGDSHDFEDLTFMGSIKQARAVIQIVDAILINWPSLQCQELTDQISCNQNATVQIGIALSCFLPANSPDCKLGFSTVSNPAHLNER